MRNPIPVLILGGLLAGCGPSAPDIEKVPANVVDEIVVQPSATAEIGSWGVDLANIDPTVKPGNDFYRYANGQWLDSYELPPDRSMFGSFVALQERSQERVRELVEALAGNHPEPGSVEQKIGDYYASFMNQDDVNARGIEPLRKQLDAIAAIDSIGALARAFGRAEVEGNLAPFAFGVEIDRMDPQRWIAGVSVEGLGLPDRDYYLEDTDQFKQIREAYQDNIRTILGLSGYSEADASAAADAVMALETAIAKQQWPRADRRNRDLTYNLETLDGFEGRYPGFPWREFFEAAGRVPNELNVRYPSAMAPVIEIVDDTDLDTWRAYLTDHLVTGNAALLSQAIDDATFEFYGRALRGQPEQYERWRRGISLVGGNQGLGDAIGQVYVQHYFPAASKAAMEALVANLQAALRQRIAGLPWMSEDTKTYAFEKLEAFTPNIGYPNEWRDYSDVRIDPDDLVANARQLREHYLKEDLARLDEPTDPHEWFMSPQTVNAYYVPQFNSITFPAAILEAPFFDPAADPAVNYGAIGAVIGHEMGHGFDDQGSKSDARGVQRNWWTDEDRSRFDARTSKLAAQYSGYEPVPGTSIDGEFTLGENIGDLGGIEVAYTAYRLSLGDKEPPVIDGYTGDQRFFLAYAQIYRAMTRDETLVTLLKSDPHSPPEFRVNGVVRNVDAWYDAFEVQPGDALYLPPEARVGIW